MIIHRSGANVIALYIDTVEMEACGFDTLCEEDAKALAEAAIYDLGITGSLSEIEAFSGNGGAMIFACLRAGPNVSAFGFSNLDSLLDAAGAAGRLTPERSSLFVLDGTYILLAYNISEAFSLFMSEYASRVSAAETCEPFIREHGKLLADGNAMVRLSGT